MLSGSTVHQRPVSPGGPCTWTPPLFINGVNIFWSALGWGQRGSREHDGRDIYCWRGFLLLKINPPCPDVLFITDETESKRTRQQERKWKNGRRRSGTAPVERIPDVVACRSSGSQEKIKVWAACDAFFNKSSNRLCCGISPALTKQLLPPSFANNQANSADEDTAGSARIAFYSSASTCNSAGVRGTWQEPCM